MAVDKTVDRLFLTFYYVLLRFKKKKKIYYYLAYIYQFTIIGWINSQTCPKESRPVLWTDSTDSLKRSELQERFVHESDNALKRWDLWDKIMLNVWGK